MINLIGLFYHHHHHHQRNRRLRWLVSKFKEGRTQIKPVCDEMPQRSQKYNYL